MKKRLPKTHYLCGYEVACGAEHWVDAHTEAAKITCKRCQNWLGVPKAHLTHQATDEKLSEKGTE